MFVAESFSCSKKAEIFAKGGGVWTKPRVLGSANNGPTIDKAHYRD